MQVIRQHSLKADAIRNFAVLLNSPYLFHGSFNVSLQRTRDFFELLSSIARMDAMGSREAASIRNVGPECSYGRNSFANAFPADVTDEVVAQVSGTPENARRETTLAWHSPEPEDWDQAIPPENR